MIFLIVVDYMYYIFFVKIIRVKVRELVLELWDRDVLELLVNFSEVKFK